MRHLSKMAIAVSSLTIGLFALSGAAGAATPGYPPPPNLNTNCSFSAAVNLNTTVTVTVTCKFAPGAAISVSLNGAAYLKTTAPASGILVETFTATDPHISMNGGPAVATNAGATNTFVATGANPGGGTNTATTLVTIPATGAAAAAASTPAAAGLAFTGADIMAMVIGALALLALGFLILTLTRRRTTPS